MNGHASKLVSWTGALVRLAEVPHSAERACRVRSCACWLQWSMQLFPSSFQSSQQLKLGRILGNFSKVREPHDVSILTVPCRIIESWSKPELVLSRQGNWSPLARGRSSIGIQRGGQGCCSSSARILLIMIELQFISSCWRSPVLITVVLSIISFSEIDWDLPELYKDLSESISIPFLIDESVLDPAIVRSWCLWSFFAPPWSIYATLDRLAQTSISWKFCVLKWSFEVDPTTIV